MFRLFTHLFLLACLGLLPLIGRAQVVVGPGEGGDGFPPFGETLVIGGYPYVTLTPSTPDQSYFYNGSYRVSPGSMPWSISGGGQIVYQNEDQVTVHWTTAGNHQVSYSPTQRNVGELNTLDVEVTCAPAGAGDKPSSPVALGNLDPVDCTRVIPVADVNFVPGTCGGYTNDFGGGGLDIFYTFRLGRKVDVEISTCRSTFDTTILLQLQQLNGSFVDVVFNDDNGSSCLTGQASVNVPLGPGTYRFVVEGYSANNYGTLGLDITTRRSELQITVPATAEVVANGNATLTVGGAETYAWTPSTGLTALNTTWSSVTAAPTQTTAYTVTGTACNGTRQASKQVTVYVLPENRNYITTHTVLDNVLPSSTPVDVRNEANLWGLGVTNLTQSTAYLDDLGRPLQHVAKQASPAGKDVVVPLEYDVYGRAPKAYLPYTDQTTGRFKTDALGSGGKQALFYLAAADRIANDPLPTASAVYEQSPLNRVLEQGAPGMTWQSGANHSVKFVQRTNTTSDAVRQWAYSFTGNSYASAGTYGAGQLLVKESRDEQDQLVTEYADPMGRTVLKRVAMAQTWCQVLTLSNNTLTGTLVLNAPAGMKFTGIRAATYGEGTGTGGACENFTFSTSTVDVTEAIRTSVASQLASNAGTLNVAFDATAFGSAAGTRALAVVATYAPTSGAPADLQTYYVYDDFNNLRLVISPEGVNSLLAGNTWALASTDAFVRNWCFQYGYDERQRVVTKQTPGTAPVSVVYNHRNQVVLTQDGAQAAVTATKNWGFTKYDGLGRPVVTGTVSLPSATRASLQTTLDAETSLVESADGSSIGYSLITAFPTNVTASNVLTVTYYDGYGHQRLTASSLAPSVSTPLRTPLVRGLVTGTSVRQLTSANATGADANGYGPFLTAATYYDGKYRVLQSVGTNHLNGTDRLTNTLDFAGRATASLLAHSANGTSHTVGNRFDYYANGQLRTTWQTMDAQPEIILSHRQYNELGQLAAKRLHSTAAVAAGAQYLQKVDYWYNIRGWLTNINDRGLTNGAVVDGQDAELDTNADPDLFGMELRYNTLLQDPGTAQYNGAKPQYNGNIAQVMWRTRPVNLPMTALRLCHYYYDPSNRITDAPYAEQIPTRGWVNSTNRTASDKDFSVSGIDYDGNGNLLHMTRKGLVSGSSTSPVTGVLDQLSYSYKSATGAATGNQLTAVNDAAPSGVATHDFKGTATTGQVKYRYDENGNLIGDDNKNISAIAYSLLNQPTKVNQSTNRIEYTYTASGTKLQKRAYSNGSLATTTDYVGAFVYEQAVPAFVQSTEGRVLLTSSSTLPWKYEYHIKDHLGNLRFAFRADRDGGTETQLTSLEPSNSAKEERQFDHLAETRLADPTHARTGNYVARLNAHTGHRQGPSIRVPVAAGDSVRVEVYGRYDHESIAGTWVQRGALVSGAAVAGTTGGVNTDFSQSGPPRQRKQPFLSLSLGIVPQLLKAKPAEVPKAYLRYELFTRDSQLVATQVQPISRTTTDTWQHLQAGSKADSAGFARISLVNESGVHAYFDDMAMKVVAPNPYQENHYDPFGLNLVGIESVGSPNSRFQYNGKEKQEDFGLNWADYGARMYDAQIGRWHEVDPLSDTPKNLNYSPYSFTGNNPISFVDPDGKDWFYYRGQGEEKKGWHYQEGDIATYTDTKGNTKTNKHGYDYLVVAQKTGNNNDNGSTIATITVFDQDKIVLQQRNATSGGDGNSSTQPGNYMMNLNVRDGEGPTEMNAKQDNPMPAYGIQKINRDLFFLGENGNVLQFPIIGAYGHGRIRLQETFERLDGSLGISPKQNHGYYLHGKADNHSWTHGCICDKTENVFNYFWSGLGSNVRGLVPFAVGQPVIINSPVISNALLKK